MKENRATTSGGESEQSSSLLASATEDELFVAQILLDLPKLVGMVESISGYKWCRKKRRSGRNHGVQVEQRKRRPKADDCGGAAAANSPVTPLSFSSVESDEKSFQKISRKRARKEYTGMIQELSQRRDLLAMEIQNVTEYYKKLNAYNSELKAMKEEALNSLPREEEPEMEINLGIELTQPHQISGKLHSQPLVEDERFQQSLGPITTAQCNGLAGPFKIPDLNISAEEAFGMEPSPPSDTSIDRRGRFAEARRRRRGIMKIKHMRSVCGIKLP